MKINLSTDHPYLRKIQQHLEEKKRKVSCSSMPDIKYESPTRVLKHTDTGLHTTQKKDNPPVFIKMGNGLLSSSNTKANTSKMTVPKSNKKKITK